jgi:hypothetical protein
MPLRGDVKTFSLPAIVRMIYEEEKTGLLTVSGSNRGSSIYFRGGKIIYTTGTLAKGFRLGELLKANKLISENKLQEMLKVANATEKRLGTILIERGYVSRENLNRILLHQFKEVITKTLTWDEAEFTFTDGLNGYVEDIRFEMDPIRLVAEAEKWKQFRKIIPDDQVVFEIRPGALKSKSIYQGGALRVLLLIDGKRSVSQIIAETGYSRLAVYRSIASLANAGAIVSKGAETQPGEMNWLEESTIILFYVRLLQTTMADLTAELGTKRTTASLETCLRQSSYYDHFLSVLQLEDDPAAVARRVLAHMKKSQALPKKEMIKGFNQVLVGLLREEYRLLGAKATTNTVSRLKQSLQGVPENQQVLAHTMTKFLDTIGDKKLLSSPKKFSSTMQLEPRATAGSSLSPVDLDNLGGAAIVTFYNEMIQVVMTDLDRELGVKARQLYGGLVQNSKYYGTLLSQFSLESDLAANVTRMREHIKTQEIKIGKHDIAQAFQQILIGLLREENRIIGARATQATIAHLKERMRVTDITYKPLIDHLSGLLLSATAKI